MSSQVLLLALTAALLLSGCAGKAPPAASVVTVTHTVSAAPVPEPVRVPPTLLTHPPAEPDAAAEPQPEADPEPAAPAAAPAPPAPEAPAEAPAPAGVPTEPVVARCRVTLTLGAGSRTEPFLAETRLVREDACASGKLASRSGGPFRSAVVEFNRSEAPTVTSAWFAVSDRDGGRLGSAEGPGQRLLLVLSPAELPSRPVLELVGHLGGTGLFVQYEGTFTFSLFETPEPPVGYSAAADPAQPAQ